MEIKKLTKEDFIKIIANIKDTLGYFDTSQGFTQEEVNFLNEVSSKCVNECSNNIGWNLFNKK
jgi:hypothetical protein